MVVYAFMDASIMFGADHGQGNGVLTEADACEDDKIKTIHLRCKNLKTGKLCCLKRI